MLIQATSR